MTVVELRPLSLGELLDRIFTLYRQHLWLFAGIMALPSLVWYGYAFILGPQNPFAGFLGPVRPVGPVGVVSGGDVWGFMAIFYGYFALYLASYAVAMGAGTFAISEVQLGRTPTMRGSYGQAVRRIGGLLDLFFSIALRLVGCVFLGGFLSAMVVMVVPNQWRMDFVFTGLLMLGVVVLAASLAVVLGLGYAVAMPAMLLEGISARQAMKRSWAFTKGQRGRVLLIIVLAVVVAYVAAIVIQGPFWMAMSYGPQDGAGAEVLGHLAWVAGVVAHALSGPMLVIGIVLLYFDLRVRKEGLDLKLMMDSLQPGAAPPAESTGSSSAAS